MGARSWRNRRDSRSHCGLLSSLLFSALMAIADLNSGVSVPSPVAGQLHALVSMQASLMEHPNTTLSAHLAALDSVQKQQSVAQKSRAHGRGRREGRGKEKKGR